MGQPIHAQPPKAGMVDLRLGTEGNILTKKLVRKRALLKYDDAPPSASGLEVQVYLASDVDAEIERLRTENERLSDYIKGLPDEPEKQA